MRKALLDRRGFTTAELLVAAAIGVLAAGLITQTLFQVISSVSRGAARLQANSVAANALLWLGRDLPMASDTDLADGAPPASTATLTWVDRFGGAEDPHQASYAVQDGGLRRIFDGVQATVARQVESARFSRAGQLVTVVMRVGGQDYTLVAALRPGG